MEISQEIKELHRLAEALEKEYATWAKDYDISDRPQFPTHAYEEQNAEEQRRAECLWNNAIKGGEILLKLHDAEAFDQELRIKNALGQMRAEMERARVDNEAPQYNKGRKRPAWGGSQPWSEKAREMFLVKMVEGFRKIWATSYEDRRAFVSYYVPLVQKAALQAKMFRSLADQLKKKNANSGG